jgi:hypothetical protein
MPDKKLRKMLMTIRAALIMAAKAIEEYCREEAQVVTAGTSDSITLST